MTREAFKPKILGFLCNWCCYAAADSAGVGRYQYPPNLRTIRVMCTGRIDPLFIVEGFACGADGIFVGGCHLGECHYQLGNYDAMITAELVREILEEAGVNPERFTLEWASAAEGPRYVQLITAFTKKIEELGPLGQSEGKDKDDLIIKLQAARSATEAMRLRTGLGKMARAFREEGDYSLETIRKRVKDKLGLIMKSEANNQEIILRLKRQGPLSVDELAGKVGLPASEISDVLNKLGKKGRVSESDGRWVLA